MAEAFLSAWVASVPPPMRCPSGGGVFNFPLADCAGRSPLEEGAGVASGFSSTPAGGGGCTVRRVVAFSPCLVGWCGGVPWLSACFFPFRGAGRLYRVGFLVSVPCLGAVVCFGVPCCVVLCFAVLCRAFSALCCCAPCSAVPCRALLCRVVPCRGVACLALLCSSALCRPVLCRVLGCRAALRCTAVCCAAVCCAV